MAARFVNIGRETLLLMPLDMRDWVPVDHLVNFILDAVSLLELSGAQVNYRGTGDAQYPPATMLALLIYSYATGVFSSRQIERRMCSVHRASAASGSHFAQFSGGLVRASTFRNCCYSRFSAGC